MHSSRAARLGANIVHAGNFSDGALVLIGHGSTVNTRSAMPTYDHAKELRRRGLFAEVHEAFWKHEPTIASVLEKVKTPRVWAVPLFISDGYFTDEAIPKALGFPRRIDPTSERVVRRGDQLIRYARPVGTHPSMTKLLLDRADEVVAKHPFPRRPPPNEIALFIVGHGTPLNENSRAAIERQVELIRQKKTYAEVHPLFLEEAPRVPDCYSMTSAKYLVVAPFFISEGLHSQEHIPVLLGEPERVVQDRLERGRPTWRNPTEKKGKLVWYASSVGTDPKLVEIILDRVRELP